MKKQMKVIIGIDRRISAEDILKINKAIVDLNLPYDIITASVDGFQFKAETLINFLKC